MRERAVQFVTLTVICESGRMRPQSKARFARSDLITRS